MGARAMRLAVSTALLLGGCAAPRSGYLNPAYRFESAGKPKLAIAPILSPTDKMAQPVDEAFAFVFGDKARPDALVPPAFVRGVMESDRRSSILLGLMSTTEFPMGEKADATVAGLEGVDDLDRLRRVLRDADLLLIPRAFGISERAGVLFGACTFRLFDLRTGQMVYEHSTALSIDKTGERAASQVSRLLTILAYEHYEKTVLRRFRGR
jgi:hypothetical protein